MNKIIFFGNGPLAEYALDTLADYYDIIFHAKTEDDLEEALYYKELNPEAYGVLASFGVMLPEDFLEAWEPEGILNIHPSLLPKYRGPSPIESSILDGEREDFGLSIMKVTKDMDAGPIYHQETVYRDHPYYAECFDRNGGFLEWDSVGSIKQSIYYALARVGAEWLIANLDHLPEPKPQQGDPTFTKKFNRSMSYLDPASQTCEDMWDQLIAFFDYPKTKYKFFGTECTILDAHGESSFPDATPDPSDDHLYTTKTSLALKAKDGQYFVIDRLQPANKTPMDTRSFLNGYKK